MTDNERPAFEVMEFVDGALTGKRMAVYASGRTEGFPPGYTVIVNRVPALLAHAAATCDRSPTGGDAQRLHAKHESAVPEGQSPNLSVHP